MKRFIFHGRRLRLSRTFSCNYYRCLVRCFWYTAILDTVRHTAFLSLRTLPDVSNHRCQKVIIIRIIPVLCQRIRFNIAGFILSVVDRSSTFVLCRTTDIWYPYTDRWIVRTCVILRTTVTSRIFGLVAEVSQRHTSGIDCTNVARSEFHWFHTDSEIACIYSDLADWDTGASAWRCFLSDGSLYAMRLFPSSVNSKACRLPSAAVLHSIYSYVILLTAFFLKLIKVWAKRQYKSYWTKICKCQTVSINLLRKRLKIY